MINFTGNEQFDIEVAKELFHLGLKDITEQIDKRKGKLLLIHNGFEIYFDYITIYYVDENFRKQINSKKVVDIVTKIIELRNGYDSKVAEIINI